MPALTSIESEFATTEDAAAYDAWFRTKVAAALASTVEPVPHDAIMAQARTIIEERRDAADRLAG